MITVMIVMTIVVTRRPFVAIPCQSGGVHDLQSFRRLRWRSFGTLSKSQCRSLSWNENRVLSYAILKLHAGYEEAMQITLQAYFIGIGQWDK